MIFALWQECIVPLFLCAMGAGVGIGGLVRGRHVKYVPLPSVAIGLSLACLPVALLMQSVCAW